MLTERTLRNLGHTLPRIGAPSTVNATPAAREQRSQSGYPRTSRPTIAPPRTTQAEFTRKRKSSNVLNAAMPMLSGSINAALPSSHVTTPMSASDATFTPSSTARIVGDCRRRGSSSPLKATNTMGLVEVRYLKAEEAALRFGLNANGAPVIVLLHNKNQ